MGITVINKATGEAYTGGRGAATPAVSAGEKKTGGKQEYKSGGVTLTVTEQVEKRQNSYVPARKNQESEAPSLTDRLVSILAGAGKSYAADLGAAAGAAVQAGQYNTTRELRTQYEAQRRRYEQMLADNEATPGKWSDRVLEGIRTDMERTAGMLESGQKAIAESGLVKGATKLRESSGALRTSSQEDIERGKQGVGAAGQFLVDVGVAGGQLAADMGANLLLPGAGMALMGARAFGSEADAAQAKGATLDQQVMAGLGSAAISMAVEKIANVAKPFRKAFGAGVLDDAITRATGKLSQSAAGKVALSALAEGGEEFVEAVLQPVLQRATYDPEASFDLGEALYQAAIGAALGGVGGGVDAATSRKVGGTPQNTPPNPTAQRTAQSEGVDTTRSESPAETPTDPLVRAMLGRGADTTSIDTDPNTHTQEENRRITDYVNATNRDLLSWLNRVRAAFSAGDKTAAKMKRVLGVVKENTAKAVQAVCGVDVTGYRHMIDGAAVQHIEERHGAAGSHDSSMAAVEDIARVEYVLDNFDGYEPVVKGDGAPDYSAQFRDRNNRPAPMIRFYKRVDGTYYVVEAAPDSADRKLHIVSAYMTKNDGSIIQVLNMEDSSSPQPTPEAPLGPVAPANSKSTVAQDADSVNPGTVGAAAVGFETPDSPGVERISRQVDGALAYNTRKGEASARSRAEYDEMFRYMSRPEAQSMQEATNLLYVQQNGETLFTGDLDPEGLRELMDYMRSVPAWNDVLADVGHLLEQELRRRAILDPSFTPGENTFNVTEEDYYSWAQTIREKVTDTARGVQAQAKWTRADNNRGQTTEAEAWENLESSNLSEEERREIFGLVVKFDREIEAAQTNEDLAGIIMEIADRRGTTHGLTGKQSRRLVDRARKALESLTFAELKQLAYSSSAALTTDSTPADTGSKLKVIQLLNMLSNPKTAATNLAGNTSFYGIDAMAMKGAAVLDMALSKLTGTRSVAAGSFVGGKQRRAEIVKAMQRSLAEITLDVDMGGDGRYQQGSRRTFKANGAGLFNTGTAADLFVERVLSVLERNMGYALTTTDEVYKGAARSTAVATQRLVDEGKIKTQNKNYAKEQADELALRRTFQKDGYISDTLQILHDWLNAIPHLGVGDSGKRVGKNMQRTVHAFGAGDLVAPFTRVAGNLVSTAVDYNPVKAVQGTVEIIDTIRRARAGDVDPERQAKGVSDLARGLTGTAISMAATAMAKAGLLKRAEDEEDADVAALNQSEGMVGTQINIDAALRWAGGEGADWHSGDTLVDVSRLEPLNFLLSFGVEMADNENDDILSTVGEVAGDAGSSFASAAGDLPVMGTIGGVAKDVLVYDDPLMQSITEHLGKTAISSVTPNILAAFAKGWDEKQRSVYSGDGVEDVLLDTIKSRIPGLREQLPTTVNILGEEKDNPGTLGQRLLNAMLNPIGVNEYSQSEVSREMERVREETGQTGFYPTTRKPDKLSWKDEAGKTHEVALDYEQQQRFQAACSAVQMSMTAELIGSGLYKRADEGEQAALLKRCYDYAYQQAKAGVLGDEAVDGWVVNARKARQELGISTADFLCYYEKYGSGVMGGSGYDKTRRMVEAGLSIDQWAAMKNKVDTDGNGSVKKAEVTAYIEANFPREKWSSLFDAYKGGSNWKNPY